MHTTAAPPSLLKPNGGRGHHRLAPHQSPVLAKLFHPQLVGRLDSDVIIKRWNVELFYQEMLVTLQTTLCQLWPYCPGLFISWSTDEGNNRCVPLYLARLVFQAVHFRYNGGRSWDYWHVEALHLLTVSDSDHATNQTAAFHFGLFIQSLTESRWISDSWRDVCHFNTAPHRSLKCHWHFLKALLFTDVTAQTSCSNTVKTGPVLINLPGIFYWISFQSENSVWKMI